MKKLVLDPGHSGSDPGAVGNGIQEKDVNLDLANRVAAKLSGYDVEVTLTHTADVDMELDERCKIANSLGADYFCSLHSNAGGGTGFESYVYTQASGITRQMQDVVHEKVAAYYTSQGLADRGRKQANFFVLRETGMPAILLENLFVDNPADAEKLKDAAFLDGLAGAIAQGLAAALGLSEKAPETPQEGTPIAGPARVALDQARAWANSRVATPDFVEVAALYWELAPSLGIRPEAAYAQAAKETGFGRFGGVITRDYNNWCGLKTEQGGGNYDPAAHQRFPDDRAGVLAHLQHLAAYAGLPVAGEIVDPRYKWVKKGCAPTVEALGGKWAPSPDYGLSIVRDYLAGMLDTPAPDPCAGCAKVRELQEKLDRYRQAVDDAAAALDKVKGVG